MFTDDSYQKPHSGDAPGLLYDHTWQHAGVRQVDCLADSMIQKAINRDVSAATFVRDTSDGRPRSSDDDDTNIGGDNITIEWVGTINVETK